MIDIELSVKKQKKKQHELIGNIKPYDGHTLWEVNTKTLKVEKAKFSNVTYYYGEENKKEIIIKDHCFYVSALNKKSALKKMINNNNGSKIINTEDLLIYSIK